MNNYTFLFQLPNHENAFLGSQTEENLWKAFIGESMARNRYTYYASYAKKLGYEQISEQLLHIADNEKEHAKLWFKHLCQLQEDLGANLRIAAQLEREEWSEMYEAMAEDAVFEGYPDLADQFKKVAAIEQHHEKQLLELILALNHESVFDKKEIVVWQCRNCGHLEISDHAPTECSVCHHPQGYFQLYSTPSDLV